MKLLISDIETNGLLDTVDKFHCSWTVDYFTGEWKAYRPWDFEQYIKDLEACAAEGGVIVFHNGIKYDYPALKKLKKLYFGKNLNIPKRNVLDTLVMSRLLHSNLKDTDAGLLRSGRITGKLYGSHSLKAWGMRLGELKGDYGEQEAAWIEFNEPMMDYCKQDVQVTLKLFEKFMSDTWYFPNGADGLSESVLLEHEAAWLLAKQERNGYAFDTQGAERLYAEVAGRRAEILMELTRTFGSWYEPKGGTQPFLHPKSGKPLHKYPRVKYPKAGSIWTSAKKPTLAKTLYLKDAPFTPIQHVTFNPSSRAHIIKVLKDCGWVPTDFTEAGNPIVDDDTLSLVIEHKLVPEEFLPKVELIKEYLVIQKLIGQLAEGDNAWLRMDKGGYIHGQVNPNGAVTGRATHSYPNLAQVPSIRKYKGVECRSLFGAEHHRDYHTGKPWIQVGVDASGLELRCLGHFMAKFDDGEYINTILNGDIHTQNQIAAGLPTRDNAKTFIYGFLYGAGAQKIGEIVGKFGEEGKKAGAELIKKFLENTPAIASLREQVADALIKEAKWVGGTQQIKWKRKWIKGLDGRKVHVRSPHAALNTLLQSAGALICKKWIVEWDKGMQAAGYKHGWDGDYCFMAWVHDEAQLACRTQEIAEDAVRIAQEAMRRVGEHWNFRCPLDTEGKIGANWAICH
ncbi:DNA polymerase I protein [Vibrio phage 4141]|uniref:DNA polymerase n=2 Tax=Chatterjeevirus TaxID=2732679 RepID=D0Q1A1_9CAUD|nr:DNA polymerase I [Vibrio phage N4]ACR16482.1 DNA polymerase [Vibrio phage N4]